jgi:hypothetical protein
MENERRPEQHQYCPGDIGKFFPERKLHCHMPLHYLNEGH